MLIDPTFISEDLQENDGVESDDDYDDENNENYEDGDDNVFKVAISSPYVTQDWDITGDDNTIDYIGIGNANASSAATGHTSTINITGDYWDVDLIQRSTNNNDWVNINATGSGTSGSHATLCIVQNDSGSAAGC